MEINQTAPSDSLGKNPLDVYEFLPLVSFADIETDRLARQARIAAKKAKQREALRHAEMTGRQPAVTSSSEDRATDVASQVTLLTSSSLGQTSSVVDMSQGASKGKTLDDLRKTPPPVHPLAPPEYFRGRGLPASLFTTSAEHTPCVARQSTISTPAGAQDDYVLTDDKSARKAYHQMLREFAGLEAKAVVRDIAQGIVHGVAGTVNGVLTSMESTLPNFDYMPQTTRSAAWVGRGIRSVGRWLGTSVERFVKSAIEDAKLQHSNMIVYSDITLGAGSVRYILREDPSGLTMSILP